ncbi:MAG: FAD-dependent oxidoreductase [Thermodesulfobacteriota bacterium]|nr:FAD-dependent oxidoreductase [Thermodesulfobacteriota bacterium]
MSSVLIIGGGITGLQAAQNLSQAGIEVVLVEQGNQLGGNLNALGSTFPEGREASELIASRANGIKESPKVTVFTETEVSSLSGEFPQFKATLKTPAGEKEVESRGIIVATGFLPFNPMEMKHYGFGKHPDVITALELAGKIRDKKIVTNSGDKEPASISFIQCIGSRDQRTHTYCSAFCCMYAVHMATLVKEQLPNCRVTILYMDLRTPFCTELSYEEARRSGVAFLRSKPARIKTATGNGHLTLQYEDTLDGELRFLDTEMVVLSIGAEPTYDAEKLAASLKIDCEESGFFKCEREPVFTKTEGVFVAGAASGPKDITTCLAEGSAAAAQTALLLKG